MSSVDYIGRKGLNTIFGDQIVAERNPDVLCQFQYGVSTFDTIASTTGTGTVTGANGNAICSTGAGLGKARLESRRTLRYEPGFDGYGKQTAGFTNIGPGVTSRFGLFDAEGGFWYGYEDGEFKIAVRNTGVDTYGEILAHDGLVDFIRQPEFMNIFRLSYGYLGIAPVILERNFGTPHYWKAVAVFDRAGLLDRPHTSQPTQPLAMEIERTSGSGEATVYSASWSAGHIGARQLGPADRAFSLDVFDPNVNGEDHMLSIRNKPTFQGLTNKVQVHLDFFSVGNDDNAEGVIRMYRNANLVSPTWTDKDTENSVVDYAVGQIGFSDGIKEWAQMVPRQGVISENVSSYMIDVFPGETLTLTHQGTTADVYHSIRWREFF